MVGQFLAQDKVRVGKLTGYAGCGKTTLIGVLSDKYGEPVVCCPTGKASLRVREVTGLPAITIHRFLYDTTEDAQGKLVFTMKSIWSEEMVDMKGSWALVDEASMVGADVWVDLLSVANRIGFHILLMGDLAQLPPVSKTKTGDPFSTLNIDTPFSINLTEVHRQALGSPVIRASMLIRSGRPEHEAMALLTPVGSDKLVETMIQNRAKGGVTLCFTNAKRHQLNNAVRSALGYLPDTVNAGEPLLVMQNQYGLDRYNGEVATFDGWLQAPEWMATKAVTDRYTNSTMSMSFGVGEVDGQRAVLSPDEVTGRSEAEKIGVGAVKRFSRYWYQDFAKEDFSRSGKALPHLHCNYGYALTCHKSQGSEWDEVLVVVEQALGALRGIEKRRWLYTAVTRGKESVKYCYVE